MTRIKAIDEEEASLVASGQMSLPKRKFDEKRFWAIGAGVRTSGDLTEAIQRAMDAEREAASSNRKDTPR